MSEAQQNFYFIRRPENHIFHLTASTAHVIISPVCTTPEKQPCERNRAITPD
jgi:hypothetical protein